MLELIVLGQIPGTSFVITLNWALFMLGSFITILYMRHIQKERSFKKRLAGLNLRNLDLNSVYNNLSNKLG